MAGTLPSAADKRGGFGTSANERRGSSIGCDPETIRRAHGARPGDMLWMFAREGLDLALAGAAIGLAGALVLTRLMTTMLFGVKPSDPATLTLVPLALVAVSTLASLVPAYRASRIDAVTALKAE